MKVKELIESLGDTHNGQTLDEYLDVVHKFGFRDLNKVPFRGVCGVTEHLYFLWHDGLSILLKFDTWDGKSVNGGKFHYCVKPQIEDDFLLYSAFYSSGGTRRAPNGDLLWQGDHDCRVALIQNVLNLQSTAQFQKEWVEQPWLWPFHYGDKAEYRGTQKPLWDELDNDQRIDLLKERMGNHPDIFKKMKI